MRSSLEWVDAVQNVTHCTLVPLTVVVVLRVRSLHLKFHVFKEFVAPLSWLFSTTPIWGALVCNQSSQRFQVSIVLNLLCGSFLPHSDRALHRVNILLVPPFIVLLACPFWWLVMSRTSVFITNVLIVKVRLHDRCWVICSQISVASEPLQHWVLVHRLNRVLSYDSLGHTYPR